MSLFWFVRWIWVVALTLCIVVAALWLRRRDERAQRQRFDVRVCPACGANNPDHARFCARCGGKFA